MLIFKSILAGILLLVCSIQDISKNKINVLLPAAGGTSCLLINVFYCGYSINTVCADACIGIALTIYALASKENIGFGDCAVFIMIGFACGLYITGMVMIISSIISAVYMRISNKHSIPFLPLVTLVYTAIVTLYYLDWKSLPLL